MRLGRLRGILARFGSAIARASEPTTDAGYMMARGKLERSQPKQENPEPEPLRELSGASRK